MLAEAGRLFQRAQVSTASGIKKKDAGFAPLEL
jgi:hypothetical protein